MGIEQKIIIRVDTTTGLLYCDITNCPVTCEHKLIIALDASRRLIISVQPVCILEKLLSASQP
ncbi:MAG: hypothetical protein N2491_06335 [Negativicutes bacterium]|nr:hypothetical protein [Negativicutes bacterium]